MDFDLFRTESISGSISEKSRIDQAARRNEAAHRKLIESRHIKCTMTSVGKHSASAIKPKRRIKHTGRKGNDILIDLTEQE